MPRLLPGSALLAALFAGTPVALGADAASGARHLPAPQEPAALLPRYLLSDPQGRAVSNEDFRGRFQLVTFGFVSCPDVCPTTLLEFTQVLKMLGDEAKRLQPVFITIDPERDSRDILREYTAAFDARILGLTGSPELVRRAADSFRIQYEKVREPGARPEHYTMNHTAGMVLLDTQGRFVARFGYGVSASEIGQRIRAAMNADGGR